MTGRLQRRHPGRSRHLRAPVIAATAGIAAAAAAFSGLPSPAPALAGGAVPVYDHIFSVVESGQPASAVLGTASYLTALADANAQAADYTAVDASSLADRFALSSGQTYGVTDCLPADCPQAGDNLATRIDAAGRTWGAYAESMPAACSTTATADFAPQRVPFLYDTALAGECASRVVPYTQLASDLASDTTTPDFVWISPNLHDDMSASVGQGDSWLLANLPAIFASPAWRTRHSLLVVVFDQPGAGAALSTPVPAVMMASDGSVRGGYSSPVAYNHYSLLGTVEASWGLPTLGAGDTAATVMSDMFTAQPPGPTPTPSPTSSSAPTPTPTAAPGPTLPPSPTGTGPSPPAGSSGSSGSTGSSSSSSTAGTNGTATSPAPSSPSASAPQLAAPTAGSNEFTVSNPVLDVVDLTYVGPTTISSGSVPSLPVLEFTATSLTASSGSPSVPSLSMQSPCSTQNGMALAQVVTVPGTASASFSGSVTLYVSSIDFTYLGTAYSFTAAAPPASFGPVAGGQLTGVAMVAARFSAAATQLPGLQSVAFFQC